MPYISKEAVKEMRTKLRKKLPQFKLSVRNGDHTSVDVIIRSGPIDFPSSYDQVNQYHFESHDYSEDAKKVFRAIMNIVTKDMGPGYYDGDYGNIPDWYTHISVGNWDKPYEIKR
jgi:hypothetical protein